MKKSGAIAVMLLLTGTLIYGCYDNSQSTQPIIGSSGNMENMIASGIAQNELTLLRLGGIDTASGKGIFSIGWRQFFDPRCQGDTTVGHAMAIGFENSEPLASMRRAGIDMGSVVLRYGSNNTTLQKHISPDGRVIYTSSLGPHDNSTNISFISGGTYTFDVSGSAKFSSFTTSVTAPSALIAISNPARRDSINTTNDLTITWSGGSASSILIAVAAQPPPPIGFGDPRGPGGPPPVGGGPIGPGMGSMRPPPGDHPPILDSTKAIVVRLSTNTGTYTVPAAKLQDLVSRTGAHGLLVSVSQMVVNDVMHDGGIVHVVFRNGDGVMVKVQ